MKLGILVMALVFGSSAFATTKEEAQAFVKEAKAYIKEKGFDAACAEFSKKKEEKGKFHKGELYIFLYDMEGKVLCHGGKKELIGKNLITMKDKNGKPVIQEFRDTAKKGGGFVDYMWENPDTKVVEPKLSYTETVDDTKWLGAGIYYKK
jgi:signal transduction histidine kinase